MVLLGIPHEANPVILRCRKPFGTTGRAVLVVAYILLGTLFDAYAYGIVYQKRIQQQGCTDPVWTWVFSESVSSTGIVTVPRYRVIQKVVEISGWIAVAYYGGLWCAAGVLVAHYFVSFDLLFYVFLGQTHIFVAFEETNATYWLRHPYQAGYFLQDPFQGARFYALGLTGIASALGSCWVPQDCKKLRENANPFGGGRHA